MYKTPVQLTRETWLLTSDSARQLKQVQAFLEIIEEIQRENKIIILLLALSFGRVTL